jgi:flagellar biosynthesis GTPase FlhF
VILTSLQKVSARLSYLTTGQDVPDDIEVGQACRVAELILGNRLTGEPPSAQ